MLRPAQAALPDGGRIRVVQLVATGTNGGAQEHLVACSRGSTAAATTSSLISLTDGPRCAGGARAGLRGRRRRRAATTDAVAALVGAPAGARQHRRSSTATCTGRRSSARVRALALGEAGLPRPYIVSTVHSSRVRSDEDRELLRALTPPMDRLIAVSRPIVAKLEHEGRDGRAASS